MYPFNRKYMERTKEKKSDPTRHKTASSPYTLFSWEL